MSMIAVPMQVKALVINESTDIVKLGADFAKLPYQDNQNIDRRTDIANLASSISYQPYNNQSSLPPGVHLHWTIPKALTQGQVVNGDLIMPTVSNRWIVVRRNSKGDALRSWVVESDYLYGENSNVPDRAVCIPWQLEEMAENPHIGGVPYRYLGRQVELSQWQQEQTQNQEASAQRYPDLNAWGWGTPYFNALYDECFSVFGCYDEDITSIEQVKNTSYEVIGWYSDSDNDYVKKYLQTELNNRIEASGEAQNALNQAQDSFNQAQQTGVTPEALADAQEAVQMAETVKQEKDSEATLQRVMTDIADWQLDNVSDDTDVMLCFGRIQFSEDALSDDGIDVTESEMALAPSGSEAVATYLSAKLANIDTTGMTDGERSAAEQQRDEEQERIENQLVALSLSDTVRGKNVDFINRLKTARHKQGFSQVSGGSLWAFIGIQDIQLGENAQLSDQNRQEAETDLKDTLEGFKQDWSDDLQELNEWQEQTNQLGAAIEGQRKLLYADWTKYMLCLYPTDRLNDQAYPDSNRVKHFIQSKTMPMLDSMELNQRQLQEWVDARRIRINDAFYDQLSPLLSERSISLTQPLENINAIREIPGPRYWQASEPTVLISGSVATPSQPSGDGGTLACFTLDADISSLNQWAETADIDQLGLPWEQATSDWHRQPWNPLVMEWNINLYPDHEALNQNNDLQNYNTDFVTGNYRVPLNDDEFSLPSSAVDLRPRNNSFTTSTSPTTVNGRSLLTAGMKDLIEIQLKDYLDEKLNENGVSTFDDYKVQLPDNRFEDPIYTAGSAIERLSSSNSWTYISWSPNETYTTDSYVLRDSQLYRSKTSVLGDWDDDQWDNMFWQDGLSYEQGDYVLHDGTLYRAKTAVAANPGSTLQASSWDDMSWSENASYISGDYVLRDGQLLVNQPMSCLTQRLTGLHDEYLMQRTGMRLPAHDPCYFVNQSDGQDQSFMAQIRARLSGHKFKLPSPYQRFTPIRSGVSRINQLRIVDTFGRFKDIDTNRSLLRPQRQILDEQPTVTGKQIYLPPRLVQPLRLHLRWHMLSSSDWKGYTQPTPVCGWLVYNYFDETLVIYDTAGKSLGAVTSEGEWQSEIGSNQSLDVINNSHLRTMVEKLLSFHSNNRDNSEGNNYLPELKKAIRRAQDNIDPEASTPERAFMASQPLAIVRASLNLQLLGVPEVNKSWDGLDKDLYASGSVYRRDCRQFTSVQFPVKLGEFRNLDDGLVSYWTQDQQGNLSDLGSFPQSDMDDLPDWIDAANFNQDEHDYVDAISAEGMLNLTHSLDQQPIDLMMIVEPEAPVHATCGIVPKKKLVMEPTMYKDALEIIEQSHCAAPLLTPKAEQALPLPEGTWEWSQREVDVDSNGGVVMDNDGEPVFATHRWPSVSRIDQHRFIAEGGTEDEWALLIEQTILRPEDPDNPVNAYYFMPDESPPQIAAGGDLFSEERWQVLQTALEDSSVPSLTPIDLVNHMDGQSSSQMDNPVIMVEGYFKKINLPDAQ
jgi:cell fate (sporulation/competence/biofilm development) regulator YlbF (YheA/YmcA/DUF963 family)